MDLFTIGYEGKGVREFFELLRESGIRRLLDVRLNNVTAPGRLSHGIDCGYLASALLNVDYVHDPRLGPTPDLLADLKERGGGWAAYEQGFRALMSRRRIEERLHRGSFATPTVLMCAESGPEQCHRRLVAEHLQTRWSDVRVVHL